jgi:parallel beta helix pectate lyase-like protein
MTHIRIAGLALVAALVMPGAALAGQYPPPSKPTTQKAPKGPFHTLTVCKKGCKYKTIQSAVNKAKAGDTVKVKSGTYREAVQVTGASKRYLKLVGNPKDPSKVVLDGSRGKGVPRQNGVWVNGANQVTVDGLTAKHYNGNGFYVVNVDGYELNHLVATLVGVYGVYAFNSLGGVMENSTASYNSDSGFYIGQTPPQTKPKRSIVRNVKAFGNVLGFSGTNMRYVTITKSQWFNNGTGIVPNALDSEKYAPPEDNVITDNDVFWNNFNYYKGAPFKLRKQATSTPYPVGVGILLFGGRRNQVTNNRVYGNYLVGIGALKQILLKQANAADLIGNQVHDNVFGLGGADLNGRELFYDGSGSDNCFGPNVGVQNTTPSNGSTFAPCPFTGANAFDSAAQAEAINWSVGDSTHEANWIKHPHAPKPGLTPLEHFTK